ncbi:MAG TPA: S-adenosylhomocysteine deaminase, partial [Bacteroidetes bacterium]|nr:S-adenosylhomocysteine deaminase [Bacteroidota bacterium]
MEEKMEIIRNCHLITMDRANTSYENGAIVIEGEKIIDVGDEFSVTAKYKDAETIDAGGGIVVPGFIDTHTHSAMTLFRGMADDLPLMDWLNNHIFPAESKFVNREFVRDGALIAAAEMIHSGITTFLDMYFFQNEAAKVFKMAGMRAFLSEGLINFPTPDMKSPIDAFDYVSNFIENWLNDDLISPAVAAHAPYTCSDELLVKSRELADKYNIVFNIHLSETENEVETILKEKGKRPTHYLNELGILK